MLLLLKLVAKLFLLSGKPVFRIVFHRNMNHSEVIVVLLLHNFVIYRVCIFKIYFSSTLHFLFSYFDLCFILF